MRFMRTWLVRIGILVLMAVALGTLFVLWPEKSTQGIASGEWTCSMHPQVRQSSPGQCPICGMNLIPVAQLAEEAQTKQRAGLEVEPVTHRELFKEVRTVGKLDYNESRVAYLTARIAGRVDRVYADFTGIQVKKGDHLVDIYSPDLVVTMQNLLDALRSGNSELAGQARERLRLWGMLSKQIKEIEKYVKVRTQLTIYAPIGGTVIEKAVREGQYVKEGDVLYRIADLDPIWLYLDIYEYDLAWVRYGQQVAVTLEAYPEETFQGVVTFIDPYLDDKTRTVKVRVNLKNPDRKLKPAMYASALIRVRLRPDGTPEPTGLEGKYICPMHPEVVRDKPGRCPVCEMQLERVPAIQPQAAAGKGGHVGRGQEGHQHEGRTQEDAAKKPGQVLAIRTTAVLDTGRRKVAYRLKPDGAYELVEIQVGPRAEGKDDSGQPVSYFPVRKGLQEGDRVVVRGGFLLDSQQQITGIPSLLFPQGQSATNLHSGHGASSLPQAPTSGGAHRH